VAQGVPSSNLPRRTGRYTLHAPIASGGMATVYLGQVLGAHGFSRVVAIKRILPSFARDPAFRAMFVDEARLASRVQHPNVVPILDVVDEGGDAMIVMEYVRGASLSALLKAGNELGARVPVSVVTAIAVGMLSGLHAAHEARDRNGRSLGIVHRDVSPQNVLVGADGVVRIMDFGIAKADLRLGQTQENQLKGKLVYMAPEQLKGTVDRRTDVFATALVAWGALAGRRLFRGSDVTETMAEILACEVPPMAAFRDDVPPALEQALQRALAKVADDRFPTAAAFSIVVEACAAIASARVVGEWVDSLLGSVVAERDARVIEIERTATDMTLPSDPEPPREDERSLSKAITSDWIKREETRATLLEPAVHRRSDPSRQSASGATPPAELSGPLSAQLGIAEPLPRRVGQVGLLAAAGVVAAGVLAFALMRSPSSGAAPPPGVSSTGSAESQASSAERVTPPESQRPSASPVHEPEVVPSTAVTATSSATAVPQAARTGNRAPATAAQPSAPKTSGRDAYIPPAAFPR